MLFSPPGGGSPGFPISTPLLHISAEGRRAAMIEVFREGNRAITNIRVLSVPASSAAKAGLRRDAQAESPTDV